METAAIVINAQTGIEMTTRRMMAWAEERKLCRMIIVNGIDGEKVDLPGLLAQIQESFGIEVPADQPAGARRPPGGGLLFQAGRRRRFLLRRDRARRAGRSGGRDRPRLMERYLEQGEAISPEQLHEPFERALREGHLVPVCFTSAANGAGIANCSTCSSGCCPIRWKAIRRSSIATPAAASKVVRAEPVPDKHVLAHVFKIVMDPYIGKMAVFRIHQGTIRRDSQLYIGDGRQPFRVAHLMMLQGKEHVEVPQAGPGDICATAKVDEIGFDAVLHDAPEDGDIHLTPLDFPTPIYGLAIEPERRGNEQRLWEMLQKLERGRPVPAHRTPGRHERDSGARAWRIAPAPHAGTTVRAVQARGRHAATEDRLRRNHRRARPTAIIATRSKPAARGSSAK